MEANKMYSHQKLGKNLFDIHSIIHHNNEFRNYSCIMNIFTIHYYLKQIQNIQFKPFIYNKYISRSLIQTHSHKLNYNYVNRYKQWFISTMISSKLPCWRLSKIPI